MTSPQNLKRSANHLAVSATQSKKSKSNGSITSFFGAPKAPPAEPDAVAPTSSFSKEKWVSSLTAEQKELLQLEIDTLHESWLAQLKDEIITPEFLSLKRFLKKEKQSGVKIFPPENEIYSWSNHTPLHRVKAVIVGQDPYHNHNQAHGLAFSVRPPTPAPPSLTNVYKAIKNDYPSFEAPLGKGGLLTPWAERGVLLLNTCLTVRAHQANSHSNKGWERFTQKAIDAAARVRTRGIVFLAWGTPAGKRVVGINRQKHCVLQSVHPSPLSAAKGFFTCGHFKKCNEWLAERYGNDGIIDWSLTEPKRFSTPIRAVDKFGSTSAGLSGDGDKMNGRQPSEKAEAIIEASKATDISNDDLDALEALVSAETAY